MEYIQTVNNIVNLIGSEDVGLPVNESLLKNKPNILNFERTGLEYVELGWYYDSKADEFMAYEPFAPIEPEPVEAEPSDTPITAERIMMARAFGIELVVTPEVLNAAMAGLPVVEIENEAWRPGVKAKLGTVVSHMSVDYECIQEHITQNDWPPNLTAALWKISRKEYAAWVQPTNATNAYKIGAKVTYNGVPYESNINGNTTVPGTDERWWKRI